MTDTEKIEALANALRFIGTGISDVDDASISVAITKVAFALREIAEAINNVAEAVGPRYD